MTLPNLGEPDYYLRGICIQTYDAPPSTMRFAPVMYEENPLAKKPATLATSCVLPALSSPIIAC